MARFGPKGKKSNVYSLAPEGFPFETGGDRYKPFLFMSEKGDTPAALALGWSFRSIKGQRQALSDRPSYSDF